MFVRMRSLKSLYKSALSDIGPVIHAFYFSYKSCFKSVKPKTDRDWSNVKERYRVTDIYTVVSLDSLDRKWYFAPTLHVSPISHDLINVFPKFTNIFLEKGVVLNYRGFATCSLADQTPHTKNNRNTDSADQTPHIKTIETLIFNVCFDMLSLC